MWRKKSVEGIVGVTKAAKGLTVDSSSLVATVNLTWMNAAALGLVVICAFSVIQASHACRQLYAQLQILEAERWYMEEDYGRLLLEQSTWASHHRVETVAAGQLGMAPPSIVDVQVYSQ
ncbi:MAG: cell division protein FtsL [Halioglobus sp.]